MAKMLILRGIVKPGYPRGALDEESAKEYARRRGYEPVVLDVSGETGPNSPQVRMAMDAFRVDKSIHAFYGFSGGGYNVRHVLRRLNTEELMRVDLVVVLGAPNNPSSLYRGHWELVYRLDPKEGHMAGPRILLRDTPVPEPVQEHPPRKRTFAEWFSSLFGRSR